MPLARSFAYACTQAYHNSLSSLPKPTVNPHNQCLWRKKSTYMAFPSNAKCDICATETFFLQQKHPHDLWKGQRKLSTGIEGHSIFTCLTIFWYNIIFGHNVCNVGWFTSLSGCPRCHSISNDVYKSCKKAVPAIFYPKWNNLHEN